MPQKAPAAHRTGWHTARATTAVVVAVALVVRVLYWLEVRDEALFQEPTGDAATYLALAQELASDGAMAPRGEPYSMAPLYPHLLRSLDLLGLGTEAARALQFLLGTASAVLLLLVGRRLGGPVAGWVAGLGAAVYGPFVFFEGELLSISLAVFLLAAALYVWPLRRAALPAGMLFGLAGLGQPGLLPAGLLMSALGLAFPRTLGWSRRATAGVFLLGLSLPPAVTLGRNLAASGEPVLVAVNGGINFFIGNNAEAPGTFHLPDGSGLLNRPEGLFTSARETAEGRSGRPLRPTEVDRFWWLRGVDFWTTDTGSALALLGRKGLLAVNRVEIPNHYDYDYFRLTAPVLRVLPTMALLLPFGAAGLWVAWRRGIRLGAVGFACVLVAVALFFVTGRHRLPLAVFLWPAAGVLAGELWARRRRPTTLAPLALPVVGLLVVAFLPLVETSGAKVHMLNLEGAALFQRGDVEGAKRAFEEALEADPRHPEALNNLGKILLFEKRPDEALMHFRNALQSDPTQAETYFNLEEMYRKAGRHPEALEILSRLEGARGGRVEDVGARLSYYRGANQLALGDTASAETSFAETTSRDPNLVGVWFTLSQLYRKQGRLDDAILAARKALALRPESPEPQSVLGAALEAKGDLEGALSAYERAVAGGESSNEVHARLGCLLAKAGRDAEAESHLLAANRGSPNHEALLLLGEIYARTGRPQEARVAFQALIKLKSEHADAARERLEALPTAPRDGKR